MQAFFEIFLKIFIYYLSAFFSFFAFFIRSPLKRSLRLSVKVSRYLFSTFGFLNPCALLSADFFKAPIESMTRSALALIRFLFLRSSTASTSSCDRSCDLSSAAFFHNLVHIGVEIILQIDDCSTEICKRRYCNCSVYS